MQLLLIYIFGYAVIVGLCIRPCSYYLFIYLTYTVIVALTAQIHLTYIPIKIGIRPQVILSIPCRELPNAPDQPNRGPESIDRIPLDLKG